MGDVTSFNLGLKAVKIYFMFYDGKFDVKLETHAIEIYTAIVCNNKKKLLNKHSNRCAHRLLDNFEAFAC